MNPSIVERIWSNFNKKENTYTCKICSKSLIIDESGSGEYTLEQRSFLILARHVEKECK